MDSQRYRDEKGRFLKGNPGGPGNPDCKDLAAYRAAMRQAAGSALAPDVIAGVLRMLAKQALGSNSVPAARELLDRCLGKTAAEPTEARELPVDLPAMESAKDVQVATEEVLRAVRDGRITPAEGTRLGGLIDLTRRAIETRELAERVRELEERVNR